MPPGGEPGKIRALRRELQLFSELRISGAIQGIGDIRIYGTLLTIRIYGTLLTKLTISAIGIDK